MSEISDWINLGILYAWTLKLLTNKVRLPTPERLVVNELESGVMLKEQLVSSDKRQERRGTRWKPR